ncbi:helix-turn-helix domain-containing protein [Brucella intermedia]|uniref:XRE family transcriptional regulator n=1 Tax=Brucella intermedia TaxID=94625 RepID=UPI0009BECB36|nr:XRE family transcriptional regulator [Brucella intermedia]
MIDIHASDLGLGALIRQRRKALKWSQAELGERVGVNQNTVSQWENGDASSIRNWESVADSLGIERLLFARLMANSVVQSGKTERLTAAVKPLVSRPTPQIAISSEHIGGERDVPVRGRAVGGDDGRYEFNGEILGWEVRPPMLAGVKEAYSVYVDGESMFPRYKSGETIWLHPHVKPRRGDDVVVQLHADEDGHEPYGYIKEFVGWQPSRLVLYQYNPPREVFFDRDQVISVHKVVFSQR